MQAQEKLTKEQLEQIKKFQELPKEKQQEILEQQCIFCQISQGKVDTIKVFEDFDMLAVLDINPASKGHILIFPKKHYQLFFQLPDSIRNKLFEIAQKISIYLVNILKCEGINLYVANGAAAGQRVPHFVLHVIPRFENDGINFDWQSQKTDKKELEKIAKLLRENLAKEKKQKQEKAVPKEQIEKEQQKLEKELKKFRRVP
ncbi:MAG: HIT family protein [Nanoarchaeota archaeon]|nr:HIT family protein [Nanoarchaeota archaeon]